MRCWKVLAGNWGDCGFVLCDMSGGYIFGRRGVLLRVLPNSISDSCADVYEEADIAPDCNSLEQTFF